MSSPVSSAVDFGTAPPSLMVGGRRLTAAQIEHLRAAWDEEFHRGRQVLLEDGVEFYQLVDGRYVPLGPRPARPGFFRRLFARFRS